MGDKILGKYGSLEDESDQMNSLIKWFASNGEWEVSVTGMKVLTNKTKRKLKNYYSKIKTKAKQ